MLGPGDRTPTGCDYEVELIFSDVVADIIEFIIIDRFREET